MGRFSETPTRERSELIAQYERRAAALESEIRTLRNRPPSSEPPLRGASAVSDEETQKLKRDIERLKIEHIEGLNNLSSENEELRKELKSATDQALRAREQLRE